MRKCLMVLAAIVAGGMFASCEKAELPEKEDVEQVPEEKPEKPEEKPDEGGDQKPEPQPEPELEWPFVKEGVSMSGRWLIQKVNVKEYSEERRDQWVVDNETVTEVDPSSPRVLTITDSGTCVYEKVGEQPDCYHLERQEGDVLYSRMARFTTGKILGLDEERMMVESTWGREHTGYKTVSVYEMVKEPVEFPHGKVYAGDWNAVFQAHLECIGDEVRLFTDDYQVRVANVRILNDGDSYAFSREMSTIAYSFNRYFGRIQSDGQLEVASLVFNDDQKGTRYYSVEMLRPDVMVVKDRYVNTEYEITNFFLLERKELDNAFKILMDYRPKGEYELYSLHSQEMYHNEAGIFTIYPSVEVNTDTEIVMGFDEDGKAYTIEFTREDSGRIKNWSQLEYCNASFEYPTLRRMFLDGREDDLFISAAVARLVDSKIEDFEFQFMTSMPKMHIGAMRPVSPTKWEEYPMRPIFSEIRKILHEPSFWQEVKADGSLGTKYEFRLAENENQKGTVTLTFPDGSVKSGSYFFTPDVISINMDGAITQYGIKGFLRDRLYLTSEDNRPVEWKASYQ